MARLKVRVTSSVLGPESQQSLRGLKADFNQISGAADKHLERALCGFASDLSALIHQFVDIKILEDKTSPGLYHQEDQQGISMCEVGVRLV